MNTKTTFFRHFSTQEKKSTILKFLSLWSMLLLLGIGGVKGQTLLDSYTDGDFTASPVWGGSTSNWSIVANSDAAAGATGSNTLRLSVSTGAGTQYLSTQISSWGTSQEWGFWIGRRSQALTSANQMHIWLYANEANLTSATVDGYRIAIGDDSGDDDIRLEYIVNGAVSSTVIASAGTIGNGLTDIGLLLRVTRSSIGGWEVFTSAIPTSNGNGAIASAIPNSTNASTSRGTATNNSLAPATNGYFGVLAIHSSGASGRAAVEFDQAYFTPTAASSTPTLTTPTATSITDVSAILGATVTADGGSALSARGTSYNTSSPVVAADNQLAEGGTSVAAFSHSRTGLTPQTQYFYAGYATNATGTALSGEGNFRTLSAAPSAQSSGVSTSVISSSQINLTITAATFPGNGATQAGYVVIYSTGTPTLSSTNGQAPAAGVGSIFSTSATNLPSTPSTAVNVTGLASGTTYNFLVVPYTWDGTNAATYNYLTTSAPTATAATNSGAPALSTPTVTAVTHNSATLGATVTSDGGSALSARGTSYNVSSPVSAINNQLAEGGTSVDVFSHNRTGLSSETQYFFVGYATNSSSTAISSEGSFRTLSSPPTVQAGLSAAAFSTSQIDLTITTATFPGSGATQAGYVVIYSTGTPTFTATNGQAPAAGVGLIFSTSASILPSTPSTTVNVTGLTQSTLYNFLVIPYTWDGTNASTYNYLTASAPTANATTQGPVTIAIQDFEALPATPTWNYTGGGTFDNTISRFNGARSYQLPTSTTMTTDNLDISNYTNVVVSVAYAATGVDSGEDLFLEVSYDNGSSWLGAGSTKLIDGTSNANVNINSLNGLRTPTNANPYTFNVSASETQVRLRFTQTGTTSATEFFWIDDVIVTGILNTTPTIIRTPTSLSGFTQTSATPSSEQNYTVSGLNLTSDVTITPPTGYEISTTTGGAFSATNPITLTQSGGTLVGQPVTIYVRQSSNTLGAVSGNIAHTSTGASTVNTAVSGTRTGTYYSKSTGNLDDLATWGLNTDGTGSAPANFTVDGAIYEIRNRATATIGADWTVSGTASKVVVGDGTNAVDFTIPSGFSLTGTIDVSDNAELTIENTTAPTFGTFATNSTLEYNNVAITLSSVTTYRNLKLTGSGTKTFPGNTTTVTGNLTLDGATINGSSSNPFSTILLAGNLTYIGTVTPPADANSITLSTNGTASGTQTITGAGNTIRWFRITTTTANTILLSTTGGSSNLSLGNLSGGGITLVDGSVLNMNGNDFTLFNSTSTSNAFVFNSTGSISTNSSTDLNIERSGDGNLGTLRFTSGENTIGSLTLNHTGSTNNSLTIGNALNIASSGSITITDGTLVTGGNLTLTSNGANAAYIAAVGAGGAISGNVTVERFIAGGDRKFRFLAHPFSSAQNLDILTDDIDITGNTTGVSDNNPKTVGTGFTPTAVSGGVNNPSAFRFSTTDANGSSGNDGGWRAFTSADGSGANNSWGVGQGIRVLIRGTKGQGLGGSPAAPSAVTIDMTGAVNVGDVNVSLVTGGTGASSGFNLIGNPYASPVDISAVVFASPGEADITKTVWTRNPRTGSYASTLLSSGIPHNIPSYTAVFLRNTGASAVNLPFTEARKATSTGLTTFKKGLNNAAIFELKLGGIVYDNLNIVFNENANAIFEDKFDAIKLSNDSFNFSSVTSNGEYLCTDIRPFLNEGKIKLFTNIRSGSTEVEIVASAFDLTEGKDLYFVDQLVNKTIKVDSKFSYKFLINAKEPATFGSERFYLTTNLSTSLKEVNQDNFFSLYPNPANEIINIALNSTKEGDYNYSIVNQMGQVMDKGELMLINGKPVSIQTQNYSSGIYFIQLTNNSQSQTIKFIK